jgi:23S rRNA pseudouridine2604 synthase
VLESDKVEVRFKGKQKPLVYFAYHKPIGIVTHSAQNDDEEIKDVVKSEVALKDVFPLGRLDKDSSGLIILTNDGRVTERLLGPAHAHEKEYLVTTKEKLRGSFKEKMEAGVQIDKEKTDRCKVQIINDNTFKVTLTEGKRHQIRRMCSALFQEVQTLTRIRIMNITLGKLRPGEHRELIGDELKTFLFSLGL